MRRFGLIALLALVVLPLAGCGGGETIQAAPETVEGTLPTTTSAQPTTPASQQKGNATAGKQVFESAGCTSCHTLKDAGSTGTVGPNLDEAKPPYDLVIERVTNGKGAMPPFKGQLNQTQIQDVAKYVSTTAGT
jgi:mono/diheme cytochrome c family protein